MANIITIVRVICSIALLFCKAFSTSFYILYITAGFTDMIDGTVARVTGTDSEFGAKLDTVADFILVVVCLIKLLPVLNIECWMFIAIGIITLIKLVNIIYGLVVQKKLVAVHSVMNKITGGLLFILPLTLKIINFRYSVAIICVIATIAAIQEGYYIMKGRGVFVYKVFIEKREYDSLLNCTFMHSIVSIDANKPHEISEEEWSYIGELVKELAKGNKTEFKDMEFANCKFDLFSVLDDKDWGILAESEHYFIRAEYEDASIFAKSDSRRIVSVGDFYGDPEDAYIDEDERFCITVGCGIIKYNLIEPFDEYAYNQITSQWIEVGRDDDIEWCDCIEEVTDSYIIVSSQGEDRRRFNIETLEREELQE